MKRLTAVIMAIIMAISGIATLSGCSDEPTQAKGQCNIRAGVWGDDAQAVKDKLYFGMMANLDVRVIDDLADADNFDIIYLTSGGADYNKVSGYVKNGGTVVLDNSYVTEYDKTFLGAEDIAPIDGMPLDLEYSYTEENLKGLSELLYDYTSTLKSYIDIENHKNHNYGYGIVPSTAKTIAGVGGIGVYTKNSYGDGDVFITNPMLPADYAVTTLKEGEKGEPMAFSTTAAESMLYSYMAEYVSVKKYGFALERTFGSYGTNPAAWQLHYEDITGIANKSMIDFAKYCMDKGQIPSFTLVRNSYTWFKRAESITYLTYDSGYKNDAYENAYCSGTHIVSGTEWLEQDSYSDTENYFDDNPMYVKRAYPCLIDWNEDGQMDIIAGSADGKFYYYEGRGMATNYKVGTATYLTDGEGKALSVGAYSSPTIFDIDGDGRGELISGAEDGVVRAYKSLKTEKNPNSMAFEYMYDVLDTGLTDAMVASGYLNDDNIVDLAVGSRGGEMRVYYGYTEDGHTTLYNDYVAVETNEDWVAPCIYNNQLLSGTREGFVAYFDYVDGIYKRSGFLEADTNSRRGDNRITIGMNSVPRFYDIDGDGDEDLVVGCLEYGMAYPIDSEYFPYRAELEEQLQFCRDNELYVGVHNLTHKYASPEQEAKELELHKKAFESYGLRWDGMGINQHTWYTSKYGYDGSGIDGYNPDYKGTFTQQAESGILWNSGSTLPECQTVPQNCAENAIPMPMYLPDEDYIVFQPCNTPHGDGTYSYTSVKYDMPLLFYNHCDYMYENPSDQKKLADKVGKIVDDYDYMFIREDQLAKSVSAAYNADIKADTDGDKIIVTGGVRDAGWRLYDENYSGAVGVKIVFADDVDASDYGTDADVYRYDDNKLYISVDGTATVKKGKEADELQIKGINLPSKIKHKSDSAVIDFLEGGMMCVRVEGKASTSSKGWTTQPDGDDTIFTKFGKADKLKIKK